MKRLFLLLPLLFVASVCQGETNPYISGAQQVESGTSCVSGATAIGNDTEESGTVGALQGSIMCWQHTTTCSGDIDELGIFTGGLDATEDITMGVYSNKTSGCSDNSPCPNSNLGDTAAFVGTASNPETIIAALDSAVTLGDSEVYWICVGEDGSHNAYPRANASGGIGCTGISTTHTEGTLPATLDSCATPVTTNGALWGVAQ